MRSAVQASPFNYYSTKQRAFEAHYPKATASGGGSLLLSCLPIATVASNLSESHVSIKFMPKLAIFNFKAEHRVAQRGIYHVYGYR